MNRRQHIKVASDRMRDNRIVARKALRTINQSLKSIDNAIKRDTFITDGALSTIHTIQEYVQEIEDACQ